MYLFLIYNLTELDAWCRKLNILKITKFMDFAQKHLIPSLYTAWKRP